MISKIKIPPFSIIIPIYNEKKILVTQIEKLRQSLSIFSPDNYEIILVENGSSDKTYLIAKKLAKKYKSMHVYSLGYPCYGDSIKKGISKSKHNFIIQFDIDFINKNFLMTSLKLLNNFDIIIGSKLHKKSNDKRPYFRILLTKSLNIFLKTFFSYKGGDTHGIKAYNKKRITPLLKKVVAKHHFFETELILRAYNSNFKIKELPIDIEEIRPTRFPVMIRLHQAGRELISMLKLRNEIVKKHNIPSR